jgi:AcrR family transcriptional regulator
MRGRVKLLRPGSQNLKTEPTSRSLPAERPGKAGGKRDLNRRRRLAEISEAGLALMLAHGVERITIDEICAGAGIAKGSFYRYFSGKPALVEAILAPLAEQVRAAMDTCQAALHEAHTSPELMDAYQTMALGLAPVFLNAPDTLRLYLQEGRGPRVGARAPIRALADELAARSIAMTAAAHSHGLLRKLPPTVTALAVLGAVERLAFDTLSGGVSEDPLTIASALVTMILQGIGTHPA